MRKICFLSLMLVLMCLAGCSFEGEQHISEKVSWTIPYNTESEDAVSFVVGAGEWNRPLGLYSFVATDDLVALDDSANKRIHVCRKDGVVDFIDLPEGMVCTDMGYDPKSNVLYALLFDNQAVEPRTLSYCKVDLNQTEELELIEEVSITQSVDLDSQGVLTTLQQSVRGAELQEKAKELEVSKEFERINTYFYTQCGSTELYACYDGTKGEKMFLILVEEGEIIKYSDVLHVGEFLMPSNSCAYMYEAEGSIHVVYLTQTADDELKVEEVKLLHLVNSSE